MNEATLKGSLVKLARLILPPTFVIERTEDKFTHGTPDISITGNKVNSRIEVKHAHPDFKVKGIQELMMRKLNIAGFAFFLVYWEARNGDKRTVIINPEHINLPREHHQNYVAGFDHRWVVEFVRSIHYDNVRP